MRRLGLAPVLALAIAAGACAPATLEIYFIDVEGGQATLIVTPQKESLLVDTGFPSDGTFTSLPGDPAKARDAGRIAAAAREAGVTRIDYLLTTHFHADHDGGVVELARLIPIGTFVDHGNVPPAAESVPGTLDAFERYASVRAQGRHLQPGPGATIPLRGVEAIVVSAAGSTIPSPFPWAGGRTAGCQPTPPPAQEVNENPRSTGFVLRFGPFRFLDLGDLSGEPLYALACPDNRIGPVDVYLVTHHGGADAADPATFAAFKPRVAIVNNGEQKGGAPETLEAMRHVPGLDVWQLHRSTIPGAANHPDDRIANLNGTTAHWIRVSANQDGRFTVTNGRTGYEKRY